MKTKVPKEMTRECANKLFRDTGGSPIDIFNEERRKYDRYVEYRETGQRLGPFLTLNDFKRAAIDAYVEKFRVLPTFPRPLT
jgi:hypothetical protein